MSVWLTVAGPSSQELYPILDILIIYASTYSYAIVSFNISIYLRGKYSNYSSYAMLQKIFKFHHQSINKLPSYLHCIKEKKVSYCTMAAAKSQI